MTVYLGAPDPTWISITSRPLFVSHNRLRRIRSGFSFPVSYPGGSWVLDSGGYDLIARHGRYADSPEQYVRAVRGYDARIGNLCWAAIQDWPCRKAALARSGGTVADHQDLTVQSYLELTALWDRFAPHRPSPFRPILQGDTADAFLRCWDLFERRGVDLTKAEVIGVGSVAHREHDPEIAVIVAALRERTTGRFHGFGIKAAAVGLFDDVDSMSWSRTARLEKAKHPRCTAFHRVCSSCFVYAEHWHDEMVVHHARARAAS